MLHYQLALPRFLLLPLETADILLATFGQASFEGRTSCHDFVETINAVVDSQRTWKRATIRAWDVAKYSHFNE